VPEWLIESLAANFAKISQVVKVFTVLTIGKFPGTNIRVLLDAW
jgi:hypothetical protein